MIALRAWIVANPGTIAIVVIALINLINAALPHAAWRTGPRWKRVLSELLDRAAVLARADSPQTLTWPVIGRSLVPTLERALAELAAEGEARRAAGARTTQPAPPPLPRGRDGFVRTAVMSALGFAATLVVVATLLMCVHGCAASQVHTQAIAADTVARTVNAAQPSVIAAYEALGHAAVDHACCDAPVCCDRAAAQSALAAHRARWRPTVLAWEAARVAHDAWRGALMACQETDGGSCPADLATLAARFAATVPPARCALRAVGRADLDPLPTTPLTCTDGGL